MPVSLNDVFSKLVIPDTVRPYLFHQRGDISHVVDPIEWDRAYRESLWQDYEDLRPYLPDYCARILDIGGGMGGLGILLFWHYRERQGGSWPTIAILDGADDLPEPDYSWQTHSSSTEAHRFYRANDAPLTYLVPWDLHHMAQPVDLVVSLRAWCFHFAPQDYLPHVLRLSFVHTPVFVDLRIMRPRWRRALEENYTLQVLTTTRKSERCLLVRRNQ